MSSTIIILEVQIYENVENDEGALTGSLSDSAAASAGRVKSSSHKQKCPIRALLLYIIQIIPQVLL